MAIERPGIGPTRAARSGGTFRSMAAGFGDVRATIDPTRKMQTGAGLEMPFDSDTSRHDRRRRRDLDRFPNLEDSPLVGPIPPHRKREAERLLTTLFPKTSSRQLEGVEGTQGTNNDGDIHVGEQHLDGSAMPAVDLHNWSAAIERDHLSDHPADPDGPRDL